MNPTEVEFFLDKSGREVKVGDYIIYGHALGRCAGLKWGKVLKIVKNKEQEDNVYDSGCWAINVIGIEEKRWSKSPYELSRKGTLNFPSRIIKATEFIPQELKDLYKD